MEPFKPTDTNLPPTPQQLAAAGVVSVRTPAEKTKPLSVTAGILFVLLSFRSLWGDLAAYNVSFSTLLGVAGFACAAAGMFRRKSKVMAAAMLIMVFHCLYNLISAASLGISGGMLIPQTALTVAAYTLLAVSAFGKFGTKTRRRALLAVGLSFAAFILSALFNLLMLSLYWSSESYISADMLSYIGTLLVIVFLDPLVELAALLLTALWLPVGIGSAAEERSEVPPFAEAAQTAVAEPTETENAE